MTTQESRAKFLESQFKQEEIDFLKDIGIFSDYVEGRVSINTIYNFMKDQGV